MDERQKLHKKQRRLVVITLVILAVWGGLIWLLVGMLPEGQKTEEPTQYTDISAYLAAEWPDYSLVSFDEGAALAVLRGNSAVTYEQAEKYGADAYEDMMDSYVASARALAAGLRLDCGLTGIRVRLEQYSTDDRVIFTAADDGETTACWRENN